ncbi:MAG: 8-oxo-dGTP diphosphatase [Candidatus Micrarchaeia archaeon]
MKPATLCFFFRKNNGEEEILLAMKKRRFGAGKWNGYGGKIEEGEPLLEAACREIKEESGLDVEPSSLIKIGEIDFKVKDKPEWDQFVHVFKVTEWNGEPVETEEMRPKWFKIKDIPYDEMWEMDRIWIPYMLKGKFINAKFILDSDGERILYYNII